MTTAVLAICQIQMRVDLAPIRVSDREAHLRRVERCLGIASESGATHVVFPEYAFVDEMDALCSTASEGRVIIAGSRQTEDDYNETVVFVNRQRFSYKKIHLSPHELVGGARVLRPGRREDVLTIDTAPIGKWSVLTCFDYHRLAREVATRPAEDGSYLALVFCPALNDKPSTFLVEAESLHNHRDTLYSIFCNAYSLTIGDGGGVRYGRSSIFGLYDNASSERLAAEGMRDAHFGNQLVEAPMQEGVLLATVSVPYSRHRMTSLEYVPNPLRYAFFPLT
jgi:predicted amidohydrolase